MYPLLFNGPNRQITILISIACLCATNVHANAVIYTCTDSTGQQTFTDRGCPGNSVYQSSSNPAVNFTPLTTNERTQLQALSRDAAQARLRQQKSNLGRARRLAARKDQRQQNCNKAVTALETIAKVRRKGYKLSAEQKLEESQSSLKDLKRENC